MAMSIVTWCICFKSDNWQAILRRNLLRSKLHQKDSCTTYSPASESTHHHGISKLFSRASTTCFTATWKDGEITALFISRQTPAWKKIFCFVLRKVTISHALTRTDLPLQFSLPCCTLQIVQIFQGSSRDSFTDSQSDSMAASKKSYWCGMRFTSTDRIPGFPVAHSKLYKYFKEVAETVLQFLSQIQWLDPRNLTDVECDITSIDSIPGFQAVSK